MSVQHAGAPRVSSSPSHPSARISLARYRGGIVQCSRRSISVPQFGNEMLTQGSLSGRATPFAPGLHLCGKLWPTRRVHSISAMTCGVTRWHNISASGNKVQPLSSGVGTGPRPLCNRRGSVSSRGQITGRCMFSAALTYRKWLKTAAQQQRHLSTIIGRHRSPSHTSCSSSFKQSLRFDSNIR